MSVAWFGEIKQRPSGFPSKGATDGPPRAYPGVHPPGRGDHHLVLSHRHDAYRILNPKGRQYAALKRLSDSEVVTLALFQQLRGIESERSSLREAARFF